MSPSRRALISTAALAFTLVAAPVTAPAAQLGAVSGTAVSGTAVALDFRIAAAVADPTQV